MTEFLKTPNKTLPLNQFSLWPASRSRTDRDRVCRERAAELHPPQWNETMEGCRTRVTEVDLNGAKKRVFKGGGLILSVPFISTWKNPASFSSNCFPAVQWQQNINFWWCWSSARGTTRDATSCTVFNLRKEGEDKGGERKAERRRERRNKN